MLRLANSSNSST